MKRIGLLLLLVLAVSFSCEQDDIDMDTPEYDGESMTVRVKFEPIVGGVLYDYVDAEFTIIGYNEADAEKWKTTLTYAGPEPNDFKIKRGMHRYTLEVKKWGITNKQAFLGAYLWDARVRDGAVPTTFVFTGFAEPRKIDYTISYLQMKGAPAPQNKTEYRYGADDRIETIVTYRYSQSSKRFVKDTERNFEYSENRVSKIETYSTESETPYEESVYSYDGAGRPTHIFVRSTRSGVTTDVTLSYKASNPTVSAVYQSSNGRSFEYSFIAQRNTVSSDQTTRGTQICSEGRYTYDRSINPLSHLGYVDYLFRNYSLYNRETEEVIYTGCAFPTLVPESYSYTYDADGYPTTSTTHYRSKSLTTQVHFFYKNDD
ncbi:MAG TPA: hypothetical protein VK658_22300 [Chryseolinea sp.]|nr:hypothetical protein [Chryseolinea sp.]